jgi:DHA1 family tetracycline resistance protein-like MFS transporter
MSSTDQIDLAAAPEFVRPPVSRHAGTFVLITVFLDMVGFGIIIPVMPTLIGTVGKVTLAEAAVIGGWMAAAYSLTQFLFGPLMGNLSDRFGRRPLMLLAILGLGLDFLLQALAPTLAWLFVGRILAGLCGASWVIANAYLADVTPPEERGKAYGIMGAAFGLGFVIGPAVGGLLGEFGPRVPFFVAAAVSMLNFLYGVFVLPETLVPENRRRFEWKRANPFGAFKVFRRYRGVIPMCIVLFSFFFFSSVYPAIWPFWGMANFGWSEWMVGVTLAIFGVVMAGFQAGLTGPALKWFGEFRVVLIGLVCSCIAAAGYGLAGTLPVVVVLMFIHGPEGFVYPTLTAIMSKRVPENAQGELQGGLASLTNIAMLAGTVFSAQIFGYFWGPASPYLSPNVAFHVAAAGLGVTLILFLWLVGHDGDKT